MDEEAQRLRAVYSQMLEGELLRLSDERDELSETARVVLTDELTRRGLDIRGAGADEEGDAPAGDAEELLLVAHARTIDDLSDLKDLLDAAGIPSFLGKSPRAGWTGVSVRKMDHERATAEVDRAEQEKPAGESGAVCPECGSLDVALWQHEGAPEDTPRFHWICEACQHDWDDEEFAEE